MKIAFLCKRRYMGKDVILDRYARLYEIPLQLARLGHQVQGYCVDYHESASGGEWAHETGSGGSLRWMSLSVGRFRIPGIAAYPWRILRQLRRDRPDLIIGASDIPNVGLAHWLSRRLRIPYAVDLYDNFEGFGQARLPGFVPWLRRSIAAASVVTTTSEPLRQKVLADGARGEVIALPSSVDLNVFRRSDKAVARQALGLPGAVHLVGTAGGLSREKGIAPLYEAWQQIVTRRSDVHLVLAGPVEPGFDPPAGARVHYLGQLSHDRVAMLFSALDVGVISILDTPFGRYCFPQKAYEMIACGLPLVAADVGAMSSLFASWPALLFRPDDAQSLADAVLRQIDTPILPSLPVRDWSELVGDVEPFLARAGGAVC
jgi:teichuronic acid biosynthesis glycosyltransferase TuaC